ncbi:prepilin-type N-terminal cleavage/methylation domain-containing protein [Microcoleus vaginatus ZQ-A3]|uniref:prepilin-type N-terminal cleavage/methylation domain-containing protein n=1 Tax=Microcoleus vaginatus TaxID=119532 RepID=UPI001682E7BF|nr:prepilin-type N-terminal cleavage/methylation domain-containing protein [Microcoleus sp. FACHB-45]
MKTPILLKVLQISAIKAHPNFNKAVSRKGDQGFTLLEVLVIALIVGILSSIAAPSWEAFISRQRIRTMNDRVFQSLRLAQSEAKRTKREITVRFNYDLNAPGVADPPTVTFTPPLATSGNMQKLANGDTVQRLDDGGQIKPGTIALSTNATVAGDPDLPLNSIVFDYQGNVKKLPSSTNAAIRRFVVTVAPANSTPNSSARQCAIVETIIGGMRTAEGTECN